MVFFKFFFFGVGPLEKKSRFFFGGAPDAPEDQAICLFAGLLANPDMALSNEEDIISTQTERRIDREDDILKTCVCVCVCVCVYSYINIIFEFCL